jgi:hypothetical protein
LPRRYQRSCDQCGNEYEGEGKRYCSQQCANLGKIKLSPPQVKLASGEPGDWPLSVHPIQVQVPVYELPSVGDGRSFTSLHYGDVHFPFEDQKALEILYAVMRDVQPEMVVCHGDLLDCTEISRYEKNPRHRVTLQQEIEMASSHLATMTALSPNAERWYFQGNHEDRLRRMIWDMASSLPERQLINLPGVSAALEWPTLLGLDSIGWQFKDRRETLFDKMILKHGTIVRKWSAFSAKAEWEKYAKSGISGHTHRRGVFEHRDHNGTHAWFEHGCLCNTDPDYCEDPDWQAGFLVVTWSEDRKSFGVEEVRIHDGKAFFRGKPYAA